MTDKQKDEYIKLLEDKLKAITLEKEFYSNVDIKSIFKIQEETIIGRNQSYDALISENKRLNEEIASLSRTIIQDTNYINYLINSKWWKLTIPLRKISRTIHKNNNIKNFDYDFNVTKEKKFKAIESKVTIIIYVNNPSNDLLLQINNINKQRLVPHIDILIIDRNSVDKVSDKIDISNVKVIKIRDNTLTDDDIYLATLPNIYGEYVVIMSQNIIIDSHYWLYLSLKPIIDKNTLTTIFFKDEFDNEFDLIKSSTYYSDLKKRMVKIGNKNALFLPENRDIIQYIPPVINNNTCVIVKKKITNMIFKS